MKPKPSEKFFSLNGREATSIALRVAKRSGGGNVDTRLFQEWVGEYRKRKERPKQLRLL